jgi:hypothetical protein
MSGNRYAADASGNAIPLTFSGMENVTGKAEAAPGFAVYIGSLLSWERPGQCRSDIRIKAGNERRSKAEIMIPAAETGR